MHRRRVHDHVGTYFFEASRHRIDIGYFDIRVGQGADFVTLAGEPVHHIDAELSVRTDNSDFHQSVAAVREWISIALSSFFNDWMFEYSGLSQSLKRSILSPSVAMTDL